MTSKCSADASLDHWACSVVESENVGVPSYVLDRTGVVRWLNAAAERLLGDVRGRRFTSVVAPEDNRRARELFAAKVLGTAPATEATAHLVSTSGTRVPVEMTEEQQEQTASAAPDVGGQEPLEHPEGPPPPLWGWATAGQAPREATRRTTAPRFKSPSAPSVG